MSDQPFLADVRAALRVEMATVHVGVAAPQLRGRIAARERDRRRTRLRVATVAMAVLGVAVAIPVVGGLVLPAAIGPPPGGVQPASVATVDAERGDLALAWAWPDGRLQPGPRHPGVLDVLRHVAGDPAIDRLPDGTVATAGPDGRLAIALPGGDVIVAREPGARLFRTRVVAGEVEMTWLGWANDGRLVVIGRPFAAPDARLRLRLVDPETGAGVVGALEYGVTPRSRGALLTWTDRGTILAERRDPRTGATTIGSLDVARDPASFEPGVPPRVRVATGLEPDLARDGSVPRGWSPDDEPGWSSVGVGTVADVDAPAVGWYVAPAGERVFDVARSADLLRLVAIVAREDGGSARAVVVDWPGSWRDAANLTGGGAAPAQDLGLPLTGGPTVIGVAPDGRSIAVGVDGALVVADLATGESSKLPPGTVFVGWPELTVAVTEAAPTAPSCVAPSEATVASITLAVAGAPVPSDRGLRPVIGDPAQPDSWWPNRLETAGRVDATAGEPLVLALPVGTCVEAAAVEIVAAGSGLGTTPMRVVGRARVGHGTAGLVELAGPAAPGDWIVRVTLHLTGIGRDAILLYRLRVAEAVGAAPLTSGPPRNPRPPPQPVTTSDDLPRPPMGSAG